MGSYLSLTTRLSLMFSIAMLAIWGLVSVVLMQSLEHHFAHQDYTDIQSKIRLTENVIANQLPTTQHGWSELESQLQQMLASYEGYYLLISDQEGQPLIHQPPRTQATAIAQALPATAQLPLQESWTENGTRYRSITEQIFFEPTPTWPSGSVLVRVALDTRYHQHFINDIKVGLAWLTGGIALISVLLGWLASRSGLKPLRSLARLSARITANKLDYRLSLADAPLELHAPIQSFNDMLDRLENSFERLTAFSSDIAHELRTPVNSLMMQTQVALTQPRNAQEYREVLYANLETAERLARMISEMLFLAKSEQGKLAMQLKPLVLAEELDELLEFFEPLACEQQVLLTRQGNAHLNGDRALLQRVFSNLLTNAIRYTPPKGEVLVVINSDNTGTTVQVINPGLPIPIEKQAHLFDRFYRADDARQPVTEGTGLGLAIAKAIVNAHQGTINVHSSTQHTRFSVWLPDD
ncbi:MAG: heavy metal sensor histidine kinase [Aeromonadales bacterium]|nr:heavy metal sensor histidine kinase [Aeromonadales bacterium]